MSWAAREMATVDLGDKRLNNRAATLLENLGSKPTLSIPAALRGWAETQAAYRFFSHENVRADSILEAHASSTFDRAREHAVVLAIQDTTELDFTGKNDIEGLGPLSYEAQRGLHVHPTFLLTPERLPLGLFDAWIWARDDETFGQSSAGLPIEHKESIRWIEGYQRLNEAAHKLPETQLVYVADREADIYELFDEARHGRPELLIRAQHNRILSDETTLRDTLIKAPSLGTVSFEVPQSVKRSARTITQSLHSARVKLRAPKGKSRLAPSIEMTVVLAQQINPPLGEAPVQWMLLTTLPVDTFEQATEKLQWYLCRWEIELLFKVLKSGCEIEELQLEHIDRLEPAIALYLIIAWRVMLLRITGRECPEMPCDVVFETEEWQAIYMVSERCPPPPETPTLGTVVRMLAGFGGYLNRKHDGHPGNKSIWIGLQRTRDFVLALAAYKAADP